MESILTSIKKLIGFAANYTEFDTDLIMHINTVFSVLAQLGAGKPFRISDSSATWSDYLGDELTNLEDVKTYVYMKVRMIFDPPTSSAVMNAMKETISELEWRINVEAETPIDK